MEGTTKADRKTIAFVIGSLTAGGAERVISTLANELIVTYNVVIIQLVYETPFYELDSRVRVVGCKNQGDKSGNILQAFKNNYFLLKNIIKHVRQEHVDVLIGFITNVNILCVLASKWVGIPCLISERNNPEISNSPKKKWETFRSFFYKRSNLLIVQTQGIKDYFDRIMPKSKVVILPNPLSQDFTEYNGKPEKMNVILNVGRLTEQKDQGMLIRAFAQLNPDKWELHIAGYGKLKGRYEALIQELGMEDKVRLLGKVTDMANAYATSKIFVLSSTFEGFPNVLIEAMYMGLACVSTDCPTGPSELIVDGENGFLVPMGDKDKLQEKLKVLVLNEMTREKFSKTSKFVTQQFESAAVAKKWSKHIQEVIKPAR